MRDRSSIRKSFFAIRFQTSKKERRKGGRGGKEARDNNCRGPSNEFELQWIESAETYKCVREAEMKGKEKLPVPFGSELIGLISKAYLASFTLNIRTFSATNFGYSYVRIRGDQRYQLPFLWSIKQENVIYFILCYAEIIDNRGEEKREIFF